VAKPAPSRYEFWELRHQLRRLPRGKILRLVLSAEATIVWSADRWAGHTKTPTAYEPALRLWFADLATEQVPAGEIIEFTLLWEPGRRPEGRNWQVSVVSGP
jgi:hypothetical protein